MANGFKSGGRKKGTPNKISGDVRAMVLMALQRAGSEDYLYNQSRANAPAFMSLVGKILPLTLAGDQDNPVRVVTETDEQIIARYNQRNKP